jgi:hypothetical protein
MVRLKLIKRFTHDPIALCFYDGSQLYNKKNGSFDLQMDTYFGLVQNRSAIEALAQRNLLTNNFSVTGMRYTTGKTAALLTTLCRQIK